MPLLSEILMKNNAIHIKKIRHGDHRGYFCTAYSSRELLTNGVHQNFVQDNLSQSIMVGTLRGLHFQAPPHAQGKLVRCERGAIYNVAEQSQCYDCQLFTKKHHRTQR